MRKNYEIFLMFFVLHKDDDMSVEAMASNLMIHRNVLENITKKWTLKGYVAEKKKEFSLTDVGKEKFREILSKHSNCDTGVLFSYVFNRNCSISKYYTKNNEESIAIMTLEWMTRSGLTPKQIIKGADIRIDYTGNRAKTFSSRLFSLCYFCLKRNIYAGIKEVLFMANYDDYEKYQEHLKCLQNGLSHRIDFGKRVKGVWTQFIVGDCDIADQINKEYEELLNAKEYENGREESLYYLLCNKEGFQGHSGVTDFSRITLSNLVIKNLSFVYCDFSQSTFEKIEFHDCTFLNCCFKGAFLSGTMFYDCNITACDFRNIMMDSVVFRKNNFIDKCLFSSRMFAEVCFGWGTKFYFCDFDFSGKGYVEFCGGQNGELKYCYFSDKTRECSNCYLKFFGKEGVFWGDKEDSKRELFYQKLPMKCMGEKPYESESLWGLF